MFLINAYSLWAGLSACLSIDAVWGYARWRQQFSKLPFMVVWWNPATHTDQEWTQCSVSLPHDRNTLRQYLSCSTSPTHCLFSLVLLTLFSRVYHIDDSPSGTSDGTLNFAKAFTVSTLITYTHLWLSQPLVRGLVGKSVITLLSSVGLWIILYFCCIFFICFICMYQKLF